MKINNLFFVYFLYTPWASCGCSFFLFLIYFEYYPSKNKYTNNLFCCVLALPGLILTEMDVNASGRVKRGRGAVGSRMDEAGPYLPHHSDSKDRLLTAPDLRVREEWEHRVVLGPEKPSSLELNESSEDGLHRDKKKEKKGCSGCSKHSRKHGSKEKSSDKKKKKKSEKRSKHHK